MEYHLTQKCFAYDFREPCMIVSSNKSYYSIKQSLITQLHNYTVLRNTIWKDHSLTCWSDLTINHPLTPIWMSLDVEIRWRKWMLPCEGQYLHCKIYLNMGLSVLMIKSTLVYVGFISCRTTSMIWYGKRNSINIIAARRKSLNYVLDLQLIIYRTP